MFILVQNTYIFKRTFIKCMAYRFTHILDIMLIFFYIHKYQLLYCILQYVHAGTLLTWLRTEDIFLKKKNPCHGNLFMISMIRFPTKVYDLV